MLVIQNGYECEYELRLFAGLFLAMTRTLQYIRILSITERKRTFTRR